MDKSLVLKAFNNQFEEFFDDMLMVFPDDYHIKKTKETLLLIRKTNPKLLIQIWYSYIALKYDDEIQNLNSEFFIEKDYAADLNDLSSAVTKKVVIGINSLRDPIRNMGADNKIKSMEYIKNLTDLSKVYAL